MHLTCMPINASRRLPTRVPPHVQMVMTESNELVRSLVQVPTLRDLNAVCTRVSGLSLSLSRLVVMLQSLVNRLRHTPELKGRIGWMETWEGFDVRLLLACVPPRCGPFPSWCGKHAKHPMAASTCTSRTACSSLQMCASRRCSRAWRALAWALP